MIAISEIERVIAELEYKKIDDPQDLYGMWNNALKTSISKLKELIPSEASNTRQTSSSGPNDTAEQIQE